MRNTTIPPERRTDRITRKNLISSLGIGFVLGIFAGIPIGWFVHQIYVRQHIAQVLLCRQQNFGLAEPQLRDRCGVPY